MKIAVIDHFLNPGAGARINRALLPAMKRVDPNLDITFFTTAFGMKNENLFPVMKAYGITVKTLNSTKLKERDFFKIKGSRFVMALLQSKLDKWHSFLPYFLTGKVHKELERIVKGFDIAFFVWPYHLECPKLDCPMVGIFHDFNYKYYFSSNVSTPWITKALNQHVPNLLAHCTPIVTSQFVADEMKKFYPHYADKARIIPLIPLCEKSDMEATKKILDRFKIQKPFLLYPTNTATHKNIGSLLAALPYIKKKGHDVCLVLAGLGTENINGKACEQGIELMSEDQDVFGLGYLCNKEIDGLIQLASVVVNCSLYEGNNGPALDAWASGTPVAMSHIPPFVELLTTFHVKAALFDPRSPSDIAEKIVSLLNDPEKTDAKLSKKSMQPFTWDLCAKEYLDVFRQLQNSKTHIR
jgi:glycosyltransferase involved in cell wall biosynthesis